MDDQVYTIEADTEGARKALEGIALKYASDGYSWSWDETRMHLTIYHADGAPFATLHVELTQ